MPAGLTKVMKPLASRIGDAERIGAVEFFGEHVCRWAVEVHKTAWPTACTQHTTMPRGTSRLDDALQPAHYPVELAHALGLKCVARLHPRTRLRGLRLRTHSAPGLLSHGHFCTGTAVCARPSCACAPGAGKDWAHPLRPFAPRLGPPRLVLSAQDLAGGATVDRRGAALSCALAAEFGSVREYCTRFEPLLLLEARAVRARHAARCTMRSALCVFPVTHAMLHGWIAAGCIAYGLPFMLPFACGAHGIPTSLDRCFARRYDRAHSQRCAIAPSHCIAAAMRLSHVIRHAARPLWRRPLPRSCRPATLCGARGACRCDSALPSRPRQDCGI